MSEVFSQNYEDIDKKEGIQEQNIPSFNDVENNIKQNYELNSTKEGAENIALNQYKEQQQLKEQKESPILQEAREWLDKEAMINEAKIMLYEKLWIDENQNNNSSFENFEKWIVDELVLNNYDLAIQVWETNWKIILDWLSQLASWEWLKQIAEAIWESFMSLFTWNAYEKWKAVAELWLIWTWVWAWVYVWKKTVKLWMKQISKLRVNKERLVNSPDVKQVVWETNSKVANIVPKKEFDFENKLADNLPEEQLKQLKNLKQKLEDKEFIKNRLDLKEFEKLDIDWQLEKLWIPKEYYELLNKSWFLPENFDIVDRYKKLQYRDEIFNNKEVINYQSMVEKAIDKYPNLTETEALLIFASTDKFLFENVNTKLRSWDKLNIWEQRLVDTFNDWLDKLPDLDWKTLRWDKWAWWLVKNADDFKGIQNLDIFNDIDISKLKRWDEIPLNAPTYVSNNVNDIFIIPEHKKNNTLIIIKWMEWQVKDISSLAMFPRFAEKLWFREIWYEWVVKPNSLVKVENIKQRKKELPDWKWWKFIGTIIEVRVKQVK